MRDVEAPVEHAPTPDRGAAVFLAGGTSGCPDRQRETRLRRGHGCRGAVLAAYPGARRPAAAHRQIVREHRQPYLADVILLSFAAATGVQSISSYESGTHATRGADMVVGADPGYLRRLDIEEQPALAWPGMTVYNCLTATVRAAAEAIRENGKDGKDGSVG
jgi:hypothetical protein